MAQLGLLAHDAALAVLAARERVGERHLELEPERVAAEVVRGEPLVGLVRPTAEGGIANERPRSGGGGEAGGAGRGGGRDGRPGLAAPPPPAPAARQLRGRGEAPARAPLLLLLPPRPPRP